MPTNKEAGSAKDSAKLAQPGRLICIEGVALAGEVT
jgi:hypothetical protein